MNSRGNAGTAAQSVLQVDGAAVFLQQIAERFVRELLKVFHLVVAEKINLPPRFLIELYAFARHHSPFLHASAVRKTEASTFPRRE
jgi:hypothetical protein